MSEQGSREIFGLGETNKLSRNFDNRSEECPALFRADGTVRYGPESGERALPLLSERRAVADSSDADPDSPLTDA